MDNFEISLKVVEMILLPIVGLLWQTLRTGQKETQFVLAEMGKEMRQAHEGLRKELHKHVLWHLDNSGPQGGNSGPAAHWNAPWPQPSTHEQ